MSIGSCTCSAAAHTRSAPAGTVQASAAILMQKKAMQQDQSSAAQLIAALPQPALASSGGVGTLVNVLA